MALDRIERVRDTRTPQIPSNVSELKLPVSRAIDYDLGDRVHIGASDHTGPGYYGRVCEIGHNPDYICAYPIPFNERAAVPSVTYTGTLAVYDDIDGLAGGMIIETTDRYGTDEYYRVISADRIDTIFDEDCAGYDIGSRYRVTMETIDPTDAYSADGDSLCSYHSGDTSFDIDY